MSKTYSTKADNLLRQIISKCYEISARTPADVFFRYSPHTSEISVHYHPKGWDVDPDECVYLQYRYNRSIYFSGENNGIEPLENILEQLNDLYSKYINADGVVTENG